jgi:hypothetical protein
MPERDTTRRPRRMGRRSRVLLSAAVAIPLLAVGADFTALHYVEWRTAQAFQEATGATKTPDVRIHGLPFMTQLVRGTLDQVDISARIPAGAESPVAVSDLDVHMTELRRNSDARTARADSATATAYVTYRDLSDALGIEVEADPAGPGRIAATVTVPLIGDVRVGARVTKGGPAAIAFEDVEISSPQLPESARDLIGDIFQQDIPLRNIPRGLTLNRISTGPSGLTATLSGRDVTFSTDESAHASTSQASEGEV